MKNLLLITLLALGTLAACHQGSPHAVSDNDSTLHQRAFSMYSHNTPIDEVIAMQDSAIAEMRAGRSTEPSYGVLSQMGQFQCRAGNFVEGLRYLQEAADSMAAMHPDSVDANAAVRLLGNLSNLYTRVGLYDLAESKNTEALEIAGRRIPILLSDLWRMRGTMYGFMQEPDSELMCLDSALATGADYPSAMAFNRCARAWFFIEKPYYAPDSIAAAAATLDSLMDRYPKNKYANMLMLGRARVLLGEKESALRLMERATADLRDRGSLEDVEWALMLLADSYARTRCDRLFDIYSEVIAVHDTINSRIHGNRLLGNDFRYRTSQLEADNRLLDARLALSRERLVYTVIIAVILLLALAAYYFMRRRQHRQLLRLKQNSIDTLIAERIALNEHIERLNERMSRGSGEDETEQPDALLDPVLLDKDAELLFRKNFNDLYPRFIAVLRRDYPGLTSGNELLVMLIALRKNNDEISLALGISRESVATARYRLRQRFRLDKTVDLNQFVQERLGVS